MFLRVLALLVLLFPLLFLQEVVISFLPWPFSCISLVFIAALPLAQRVSPTFGVALLIIFAGAMSIGTVFTSFFWHYLMAACVLGVGTYRFFSSRSRLAYVGLCAVTAWAFALGTSHVGIYSVAVFTVGIVGELLFTWAASLRHIFLPWGSRRSLL